MSAHPVSLRTILHLGFSGPALHNLGAGLLVGSSLWASFISGVIAFKTLPRQQFGNLQARTFPIYFAQQSALCVGLLGSWLYRFPGLLTMKAMLSTSLLNQFVVGPWTTNLMKQRHKLERSEGKGYQDPTASEEMKEISRKFGSAHGISSLINIVFFSLACMHVAWIGAYGFQ